MKQKKEDKLKQSGGVTDKHDKNAGSGAFNRGTEQDDNYEGGAADQDPNPERKSKEKENPKYKGPR